MNHLGQAGKHSSRPLNTLVSLHGCYSPVSMGNRSAAGAVLHPEAASGGHKDVGGVKEREASPLN